MQSRFPININQLFLYENKASYSDSISISLIKPYFINNKKSLTIGYRFRSFYNTGHTNLDNNAEIIAYLNTTSYFEYFFEYYNRFIYFRLNPTNRISPEENNQNKRLESTYEYLNDKQSLINTHRMYLYQSTLAFHYNGIGIGISNESMWFGPGFHSSLIMSNNAPGFNHYFIGTLEQIRFKNYGFNFKFFVYENNETNIPFYHSALASSLTIYNNPIIAFGFARSFFSRKLENLEWTIHDASSLVIKPLFGSSEGLEGLFPGEPKKWEPWDQSLSGYLKFYFPEEKIFVYLEIGTDDSRANMVDLRAHWDHNVGYIIGMRNYGILNYNQLFYGIEYISTKNSTNTHRDGYFRGGITDPNYYTNSKYLFSTYGGRRIGAHSGSDSDDLIFLLGYTKKSFSSILSYNFERRGVSTGTKNAPEIKEEAIFSLYYKINNIGYSVYFEKEKIWNYNFIASNKSKHSNILGFSISFFLN